ncbi:MAG: sulfurtransferase TusA family protein [Oscillospiraceae bacterium]|jgi:TusA-related sulfurtransferase|nr:sulfurtransferase TusA family protein [Oscillospiraceae bacterium]MBQ2323992.1 sulfurtransferase TusA family protein [Oscillospiraceae bacterium]MBQ2607397.1 sulfurtransferase TusA family protein [Oscillospiraceae bacterium]MBQ5442342.1 sulfurtransferase TusA family protein [Oscillospiraceae bacterium]MBQ5536088.1 sulfurtransferase TusA family protein [Oscillospiraceae bacterium]
MIDARGLSCPMPVVMVQKEVQKNAPQELTVQVDSMVCVENITRYAHLQGYEVSFKEDGGDFVMTLHK